MVRWDESTEAFCSSASFRRGNCCAGVRILPGRNNEPERRLQMAGRDKRAPADPGARQNVMKVVDSLRSIVRSLRVSGRESQRKLGISSAQLFILQELSDQPAQSINQLAARTFTHQSSVSMLVAKLVEARLVTRSPSRGDARKVSISLTSAGRAILKRSPEVQRGRLVGALRSMPRAELQQLAGNLETLTNALARTEKPAVPAKRRMRLEA